MSDRERARARFAERAARHLDAGDEPSMFEEAALHDPAFLEEVRERVSRETVRRRTDLFEKVSGVINDLRCLSTGGDPPTQVVKVVRLITNELLAHLKKHPEELYSIRPRQFEELVGEILAHYGWEVQLTPPTKDGGYDLFGVSKDIAGVRTSWVIECKKYAEHRKVGVDIVRALFGVKGELQVANAMLATTSHFTRGVHDYKASRYDLELKDFEGVLGWINEYKPHPGGKLYIRDNRLILPGDKGHEVQ